MGSAAMIPLMVDKPQFATPIQQATAGLNLQQLAGNVGIQKQVQAENALKVQAMQEDQNDQGIVQKAFHDAVSANPGAPIDYGAIRTAVAPQVRLRTLQTLDADHLKTQQAAQQLALSNAESDKNKFDNLVKLNTLKGQILNGVMTAQDPALKQSLYTSALPKLKALGEDTSQYPTQYPGDNAMLSHAAGVGYSSQILKDAAEYAQSQKGQTELADKRRTQAVQDYQTGVTDDASYQQWKASYPDIKSAPATFDPNFGTKLAGSLVPVEKQPEYEIKKKQAQTMASMKPEDWNAQVDASIPPAGNSADLNARTKSLVQNAIKLGLPLTAVQAVIKDASDQIGRTETAVRTAQATAPTKVSVFQQEQVDKPTTMFIPNDSGGFSVKSFRQGDVIPQGAVSATGLNSLSVPTANTRSMSEKAPRVQGLADRVLQLLDENEKQLGPLASRWDEFTAGKIGLKNKGYTQLRTDMGLLQTALMNMHVGARGGGQIMEHFKGLIDSSKQDPDNLRAALGEIKDYAETVRKEGGPKTSEPSPVTPKSTAPPPAPASIPTGAKIKYSPSTQKHYYSTDGGKTWQPAP